MADLDAPFALSGAMAKPVRSAGLLAALAASLMLGACAQVTNDDSSGLFSSLAPAASEEAPPSDPQKATEYWSKKYAKNPRDLDAALGYAASLKGLGQKREALAVLQEASLVHGSNRKLASDYGRLALELDQVSVAKKLLEVADDPANPDWRVILARGTALAKEGSYRDAIPFYERAQALNPNHPSILNNLALAYTMSGEADRGETLLRQASADGANAKVRQNLALVLGLQGKYDEATKIASEDLAPDDARANTALLKKMVKLDAKPMTPVASVQPASWTPAVATAAPESAPASARSPAPVPAVVAQAPSAPPQATPSKVATAHAAPGLRLRTTTIETGSTAPAGGERVTAVSRAD
jgi:Flp pilus assembly protein TadD